MDLMEMALVMMGMINMEMGMMDMDLEMGMMIVLVSQICPQHCCGGLWEVTPCR